MVRWLLVGLLALALPGVSLAAEPGALPLEEVLAAAEQGAPKLIAARLKIEEQEAKLMAKRGAFDPKLVAKGAAQPEGYSQRSSVDGYLAGDTPLGASYEVGWRRGSGDWPDYYGAYETLDQGELRLSLSAPLLRDLGLNPARAEALLASAGVDVAAAAAERDRQQIAWKAASAYWKWVASGEKLALERRQLALAVERAGGIRRQVEEGALPRMELVDNERVVLERQLAVIEAEQALANAAIGLSLWFRDDAFEPMLPGAERLPAPAPLPDAPPAGVPEEDAHRAADARPEVALLDALLAQAETERRLARNQLLPELTVTGQLSQDFGDGDKSKAPLEVDVGAVASVALPARKARGELERARLASERLIQERRGQQDQVIAEVRAAAVDLEQAWLRWDQARRAAASAREVAELERRSFELGSSDIFKLNKREETAAKVSKAEIEARLDYHLAEAALKAALGQW